MLSKIWKLDCPTNRCWCPKRRTGALQLRFNRCSMHDWAIPVCGNRLRRTYGHLLSLLQAKHGKRRTVIQASPNSDFCLRQRHAFWLGRNRLHSQQRRYHHRVHQNQAILIRLLFLFVFYVFDSKVMIVTKIYISKQIFTKINLN